LVTVLMTVRNGEPYVRDAAESVLGQTMGDLELLVVDNASTDSSIDTIRSLGDERVRIHLNGRDVGRTRSLNVGLRLARGEFVAVLDADDLAEPHRLLLQMDFFARNPDVLMLGGGYTAIDSSGNVLEERPMPVSHRDILSALPTWNPIPHSTMTYRREAALKAGGYPPRIVWAQDFGLILVMARMGRLANLPERLGSIRMYPQQMSSSQEYEPIRLYESYALLRKARSVPGVPEESRADGRRTCAELAAQYDRLLQAKGQRLRRAAFRLGCLFSEPRDTELRKALGLFPGRCVPQHPEPQRGVDR
jgi:glycosyltransferase involved in cell wall biosynthesis